MEGTLVVTEERENVNKFKNWYKEKIVDKNISSGSEVVVDKAVKILNGVNRAEEVLGTTVIAFIPGGAVFIPLIKVASKIQREFLEFGKDSVIKGKRIIEANLIGVDGSSEKVVIPDFSIEKKGKDLILETKEVGKILESFSSENLEGMEVIEEVSSLGKSR